MRKLVPMLLLSVLFASCASLSVQDRENSRLVSDLINSGQAGELSAMSASPFLLDQEVVLLPADVTAFWKGICDAGLKATAPEAAAARASPRSGKRQWTCSRKKRGKR
jgi:hypothetical protein